MQNHEIKEPYSQVSNTFSNQISNNNNLHKNKNNLDLRNEQRIIYHVKISYQLMKCPLYRFSNEDKVLYTAKKQKSNIYIGEGDEVHINKNKPKHVAKIEQDHSGKNYIIANKKRFQLKFGNLGTHNHLSVTFPHNNDNLTWNSKKSKKFCTLENAKGHTSLIIKKISYQDFEIETVQSIDPLIIFAISLSSIIGSHDEPFGGF